MKYLLAACAAAFTLGTSAFAEEAAAPAAQPALPAAVASQCAPATIPADPTLPDGATAHSADMQAGNTAYQAWVASIRDAYNCRRDEYRQALANLQAREADLRPWNDKVGAVSSGWEAKVAAFNARPARDRR